MKIVFQGKGGRELGVVEALSGIATLVAVGATYQYFFVEPSVVCRFIPALKDCPETIKYSPVTWVIALFALIIFIVSWKRAFLAVWYIGVLIRLKFGHLPRLAKNKMKDEINSYPNITPAHFAGEIEKSKRDEEAIIIAQNLGTLKNHSISQHVWPEIDGPIKQLADAHLKNGKWTDSYKKSIQKLKNIKLNPRAQEFIHFYISSVQPSVQFCASTVKNDVQGENIINIDDKLPTGPEALKAAYVHKIGRQPGLVMVAAPLSAFVTFDHEDGAPEINKIFRPIVCLTLEKQEILLVRRPSNNQVRKGTIYVYNNSTAEECVARLSPKLVGPSGCFSINFVDEFDNYKSLLRGKRNSSGDKIRHGDSIVTWPPLTEYYKNSVVDEGYFEILESDYLMENRESRIWLYGENELFDNPENHGLTWQFIECLCYRFLLEGKLNIIAWQRLLVLTDWESLLRSINLELGMLSREHSNDLSKIGAIAFFE